MNHQRALSILWTVEVIAGVLPAFIVITAGFFPYLVATPAILAMLFTGDTVTVRSAIVLNGTIIGGIMGIAAILMAYSPERLRQSVKLRRLAIIFAFAGICADVLYFTTEGLTNVVSNVFACWVVAGPVLVGTHCAYRVFTRPPSSQPRAGKE